MSEKSKDCRNCSGKPTDNHLMKLDHLSNEEEEETQVLQKKNKVNIEGLKDISEN